MFNSWFQAGLTPLIKITSLFRFKANSLVDEITKVSATLIGNGVGVTGNKLTFTDATSYMQWSQTLFAANEDFTIECKVNYSALGSGQGGGGGGLMAVWNVGGGNNANNSWLFHMMGGKPGFAYANGAGSTTASLVSTNTIPANTNHHIAVTRANGVLNVWVNGVLQISKAYTGAIANSTLPCTTRWYAASTGLDNGFIGTMWDIRIVKGTAMYTAPFTPQPL